MVCIEFGVNIPPNGCGPMIVWQVELAQLFDVWRHISANSY